MPLATQENGERRVMKRCRISLVDDLEGFYGHLEQTPLATVLFVKTIQQVMNKLCRLFGLRLKARIE